MGTMRKWFRYAAVSVVATVTSLSILGVLVGLINAPAGWANVIATAVGTIPSFELNRRWVWGRQGKRSLAAEVGPFVTLSFVELVLSTIAVHLASTWVSGQPSLTRTIAVEAASVATFGSLWVLQFVVCDRALFRHRPASVTRRLPEVVPVQAVHT
jgi:putative flippase GtrA